MAIARFNSNYIGKTAVFRAGQTAIRLADLPKFVRHGRQFVDLVGRARSGEAAASEALDKFDGARPVDEAIIDLQQTVLHQGGLDQERKFIQATFLIEEIAQAELARRETVETGLRLAVRAADRLLQAMDRNYLRTEYMIDRALPNAVRACAAFPANRLENVLSFPVMLAEHRVAGCYFVNNNAPLMMRAWSRSPDQANPFESLLVQAHQILELLPWLREGPLSRLDPIRDALSVYFDLLVERHFACGDVSAALSGIGTAVETLCRNLRKEPERGAVISNAVQGLSAGSVAGTFSSVAVPAVEAEMRRGEAGLILFKYHSNSNCVATIYRWDGFLVTSGGRKSKLFKNLGFGASNEDPGNWFGNDFGGVNSFYLPFIQAFFLDHHEQAAAFVFDGAGKPFKVAGFRSRSFDLAAVKLIEVLPEHARQLAAVSRIAALDSPEKS